MNVSDRRNLKQGGRTSMRVARNLRSALCIKQRRGYFRRAIRPGQLRPARMGRYFTVGGILNGPRGARNWALNLVRQEIADGTYVSKWRLDAGLDRMLAQIF